MLMPDSITVSGLLLKRCRIAGLKTHHLFDRNVTVFFTLSAAAPFLSKIQLAENTARHHRDEVRI